MIIPKQQFVNGQRPDPRQQDPRLRGQGAGPGAGAVDQDARNEINNVIKAVNAALADSDRKLAALAGDARAADEAIAKQLETIAADHAEIKNVIQQMAQAIQMLAGGEGQPQAQAQAQARSQTRGPARGPVRGGAAAHPAHPAAEIEVEAEVVDDADDNTPGTY
jgi:hypothetical protein